MADVLLLGAGFSRNWGGLLANEVFEHLLAIPDIHQDSYLRELLWQYSNRGGFEDALTEVQAEYSRQPDRIGPSLQALQNGITSIFEAMNDAFFARDTMEFSSDVDRQIKRFFVRFDAIFTLNQDILLEHHYLPHIAQAGSDRWTGPQIMGVRRTNRTQGGPESWAKETWVPADVNDIRISERLQPLYKLHGSSNWRDAEGGQLFVVGGNKSRTIESQTALSWCFEQFVREISEGSARLLVIGYSFRDDHINHEIIKAVTIHGLRFFVIDPNGADVVRYANPSHEGVAYGPKDLDEAFKVGLVGASRRTLSETFDHDTVSHENVTRFLD